MLEALLGRARRRRRKSGDEFDALISAIEKFAPAQYQKERDTYYYNYQTMARYRKSLAGLLETIRHRERINAEKDVFYREVFDRLREFYDPGNRLSFREALEDMNLKRKYKDIFLFFYGMGAGSALKAVYSAADGRWK